MKNIVLVAGLTLLFASACNSEKREKTADTVATDTTVTPVDTTKNEPVDSAAVKKAWETYMTPGNEHQMLAKSTGNWLAEITFYQPDGSIASTSTGIKSESKMILGNRYLQATYKGEIDGMPFEGVGTTGYDNARKIFISSWIDNMGTGIMYLEGTYKESTKTLTSLGVATDAVTGKGIRVREVLTFVDDNIQIMEMFDTKDGKESKTMSIKMTRDN
jgi:hypothetical protein